MFKILAALGLAVATLGLAWKERQRRDEAQRQRQETNTPVLVRLLAGAATDIGCNPRRKNNQDTFCRHDALGLYGVFDGMGGMAAGEIASALARDNVSAALTEKLPTLMGANEADIREALTCAFRAADSAILAESEERGHGDMGSTGVVALALGGALYLANLGDSRAYLLREGELTQLSKDHTVAAVLVELGELSEEAARQSGARNRLLTFLGGMGENRPTFYTVAPLLPGDRLLLCSDGIWEMLPDDQLTTLLTEASAPQQAAQVLVDAANNATSHDNVTALVVFAESAEENPTS